MKKKFGFNILAALIFFLISVFMFVMAFAYAARLKSNLPEEEMEITYMPGISSVEISAIEGGRPVGFLGGFQQARVNSSISNSLLWPVREATPGAGKALEFSFTEGAWFVNSPEMGNYAVIPESCAMELFRTNNARGAVLVVNNIEYTVCGIYREDTSFWASISATGKNNIYLNKGGAESQYSFMIMSGVDSEEMSALLTDLDKHGISTGGSKDFRQTYRLSEGINYLALFICSLPVHAAACAFGINCILSLFSGENKSRAKRIQKLLLGILLISLPVIVVFFSAGAINIPNIYLPKENIFDIGHYLQMIKSTYHSLNGQTEGSLFQRYAVCKLWGQGLFLFCGFIAFCFSFVFSSIAHKLWKFTDFD